MRGRFSPRKHSGILCGSATWVILLSATPCHNRPLAHILYKLRIQRPLSKPERMMLRNLVLILSLIAVCWVAPSFGKTYRWVDENGVTVYSQSPPPEGEATVIKPPPPPATPSDEAWQQLNKQRLKLEDAREDRELEQEDKQKQTEQDEIRRKNCETARQTLERLEGHPPRLVRTASGEYKPINDEERQAMLDDARAKVQEYCD